MALFILCCVVIPFTAELLAVRTPTPEPAGPMKATQHAKPQIARHWPSFLFLTPLMGVLVYTGFLILSAHTYLAVGGSILYFFGLTAISYKKGQILGDPFNAHDFDNARNLYIYPEFYISYIGYPAFFLLIAVLGGVIGTAIFLEPPIPVYALGPWYLIWPATLAFWYGILWALAKLITTYFKEETAEKVGLTFDLQKDVARFGLFPTIFLYRLLLKAPLKKDALRCRPVTATVETDKPVDIFVVQGESYFDLRRLFQHTGGAPSWRAADALCENGVACGQVEVPAWGAYTMQTEFSFLSGLRNDTLGIDRINPYMRLAQQPVASFVGALKKAGYRTICVHPAKKGFFRRSDVIPNLGFDDFIGLEAFKGAEKFGKYISDKALADEIDRITQAHHQTSSQPLFVFAITIESHGPWAKGRLDAYLKDGISEASLTAANRTKDREFALYQVHMENLLGLYDRLSVSATGTKDHPRVVGLYGDHMPALGSLFKTYGFAEKSVDYLLWSSQHPTVSPGPQKIEAFAKTILAEAGITLE